MTPLVLKIGGSLLEAGHFRATLALVARARRPVVVVPGGGPFADAVREAQTRFGFSDAAAHDMSLLAMQQMAAAIVDGAPRFVAAETPLAMKRAWRGRRVPVWLPANLCASDLRIPRDWSITSDGLAARFAERLEGAEVALVKSCAVPRGASPETMARLGIVDTVFPAIVRRAGLPWHVLGPGETATLAGLIDAAAAGRDSNTRSEPVGAQGRRLPFLRQQEDLRSCRVSSRLS